MENILTMNQAMFGNKFIEGRQSKRARKAQAIGFEFSENVVEMSYEDCDVVDGGLYLSYDTLVATIATIAQIACMSSAAVLAGGATMIATYWAAATAWINSIPVVGTIIFGLFSVSAVYIGVKVISALSQKKGLDISLEYATFKIWKWTFSVPCGLSFDVK